LPLMALIFVVIMGIRGLIPTSIVMASLLIFVVVILTLAIVAFFPKRCSLKGDYIELSTYMCRGGFRIVEVIDERDSLRAYSAIVPFGFRLYPFINGWGFSEVGNVFIFSTADCNDKWRLVKLADSNGKEFYAIICCGS